jgi:hypothetical protein
LVSLGAIVFLVLGRGGKWAFADHFSKAILFFALLFLIRYRFWWRVLRHPACAGALGFGVWYTVAGIFSLSPVAAWSGITEVWTLLVLAAVGLTTWGEFERKFLSFFFAGVVCVQTVIYVFGLTAFAFFPGNPQYISFWSCAVVFLALSHVLPKGDIASPSAVARWGWAVIGVVAMVGAILLPVRSGLLALSVGFFVFGSVRFGWRGVGGVGIGLILGFYFFSSPVVKRLKFEDPRAYKRTDIWRASLAGVAERPLLGWGPGQFENLYWRHGVPQHDEPVRYEMTTDRAHNELLHYVTESGLLGGLFFLCGFVGLWVSKPAGIRGVGLRSAWAGMGAFAMVNSPLVLPACTVLVGSFAALAPPGRLIHRPFMSFRARRWFVPVLGSFIGLLGLGELSLAVNEGLGVHRLVFLDSTNLQRVESLREKADQELHSGVQSEGLAAETKLRELLRWNPQRADLWRDLGHLKADHRPASRTQEALEDYRHALSLNPRQAPWQFELAKIFARGGDLKSARHALAGAIQNEPHYFDAWLGFGILLRLDGRPREALRWLEALRFKSEGWPLALPGDSGYRRTVLRRDFVLLDQTIALCKKDLGI